MFCVTFQQTDGVRQNGFDNLETFADGAGRTGQIYYQSIIANPANAA
jgi:hypothetical protein